MSFRVEPVLSKDYYVLLKDKTVMLMRLESATPQSQVKQLQQRQYAHRSNFVNIFYMEMLFKIQNAKQMILLNSFLASGDFYCLLISICKQFGPRLGPTERSGSKPGDTII